VKKRVKIIVVAVLCVLGAVGIAWQLMAPMQVELLDVRPQTAVLTFTEEGVFDYRYHHAVVSMVSGEVLEVRVREGQRVREGEVLAVVSATDYESQLDALRSQVAGIHGQIQSLRQQEQAEFSALRGQRGSLLGQLASVTEQMGDGRATDAQIAYQQRVIGQLQDAVRWAQRTAEEARDEYGRDDPRYHAARAAVSNARAGVSAAQVQLEALRTGSAGLEGQRQSIQAQIDAIDQRLGTSYIGGMITYFDSLIEGTTASIAQLETQMGRAEITAPMAGRVTALPVADANVLGAGAPVAVIGFGELVEVFIPTRELEGVQPGDQVDLILDRRFTTGYIDGRVAEVGQTAQVRLSALGVEERKIRVLIQPAQPELLVVGYAIDVRFTVLELPGALVVPRSAVFRQGEHHYVWRVSDSTNQAHAQQVVRGHELRDGFEITAGLGEGCRIVRDANQEGLGEGVRLRQGGL